jgi:broad specificity phosphatase PhoE
MATLYIVRHATKAWKNGRKPADVEGHQHDPPLLEPSNHGGLLSTTIEQLRGVTFDGVYCSPFLRTRQTAQLLVNSLGLSPDLIKLASDLGEYLGNQRSYRQPDLEATTMLSYPQQHQRRALLTEGISLLELRTRRFLAALPSRGNFLVVTHGLVGEKLCEHELAEGALYVHSIDCAP